MLSINNNKLFLNGEEVQLLVGRSGQKYKNANIDSYTVNNGELSVNGVKIAKLITISGKEVSYTETPKNTITQYHSGKGDNIAGDVVYVNGKKIKI